MQALRGSFAKFQGDRGTHLAAMIAYFALLSFVPLLFLALSALGLFGRADESSYLVTELKRVLPESSVSSIVAVVRAIQRNSAALGIVGALLLSWTSLSLFGALESAFNIVYGRPNRPFLHGKGQALLFLLLLLVTMFVGLVLASLGQVQLSRHAPASIGNPVAARLLPIVVSGLAVFAFLAAAYRLLTNETVSVREVLPGALLSTIVLEATFQVLPFYLNLSKSTPAAQAFGGPVILLIWFYVMANVVVFGAEVNWWLSRREREQTSAAEASGLA